jgi:proteasome lid subunit RPN8/RPN11
MEERNGSTNIETQAQLQSCDLELCITRDAWAKLMGYCRATDLEVSGFMLLERDGDLLMVTDCFIPEQVSTSASTEMDSTSIAKLQLELFKKGIIGKEDSNIKLAHFHTHPTFGVFWSGTDMAMRQVLRKGTDYYVSLVINQKGDALAAIDINGEFPMSINNLPIVILEDPKIAKQCKAEVKLKVKEQSIRMMDAHNSYLPGLTAPGDSAQTYAEWKKEQEMQEMVDSPRRYIRGDDGIFSNEHGTFANVGGEIVKLDGPSGE